MQRTRLIRGFVQWIGGRAADGGLFAKARHALRTRVGKQALDLVVDDWLAQQHKTTSAGVALFLAPEDEDDTAKVLLVHVAGKPHVAGTYSLPKGIVEEDESPRDAALRELKEETGVTVEPALLLGEPAEVDSADRRVVVWLADARNLKAFRRRAGALPKSQLQQEEVDWAGFLPLHEAAQKIEPFQLPLLEAVAQRARARGQAPVVRVIVPEGAVVTLKQDEVLLPGTFEGGQFVLAGVPWRAPAGTVLRVARRLPSSLPGASGALVVRHTGRFFQVDETAVKLTPAGLPPVTPAPPKPKSRSKSKSKGRPPADMGPQNQPEVYDPTGWPVQLAARVEMIRQEVTSYLAGFGFEATNDRVHAGDLDVDHAAIEWTDRRATFIFEVREEHGQLKTKATCRLSTGQQHTEARWRVLGPPGAVTPEEMFPEAWMEKVVAFAARHGAV